VEDLNSLAEGERTLVRLMACGPRAIGVLKEFLWEGKPSGIYQPRRWAVEALASLGAKDVLLEYLRRDKAISDPVVRLGEEAVENAAARELARWPSEEVWQTLFEILQHRYLPGALETLGEFRRPEAVPYFVRALEDDICRSVAEDALRKIGEPAKPELNLAALTPWPGKDGETPSSLRRRSSAAGLLAEMGVSADQWPALRPLMNETDPAILVAVSRIAAQAGGAEDRAIAGRRLIAALQSADWFYQGEIENCLIELFDDVQPALEEEITRRKRLLGKEPTFDPLLGILLRVKRRVEERGRK
jgi:hypothetical protein